MATYTHGHHESVLRSHRWRTAANSAAYLLPHLAAGDDLLDVGCGPATITADLAEVVSPGRVTALEQTDEAIALAREELARRGVDADLVVGDAHALDLPDDSFDVVHAHQVLQHVGDPVAVLREMRRVTRPGGLVAVRDSDYAAFAWYPRLPGLDAWLRVYQEVARHHGGEPDAGRRLHVWARGAGLGEVSATADVWCFAETADRAWWGGMWADRVLASRFAETALGIGAATRAELEEIAATWRRWAEHEDGWFLVPHGQVLARA